MLDQSSDIQLPILERNVNVGDEDSENVFGLIQAAFLDQYCGDLLQVSSDDSEHTNDLKSENNFKRLTKAPRQERRCRSVLVSLTDSTHSNKIFIANFEAAIRLFAFRFFHNAAQLKERLFAFLLCLLSEVFIRDIRAHSLHNHDKNIQLRLTESRSSQVEFFHSTMTVSPQEADPSRFERQRNLLLLDKGLEILSSFWT
jgi:hypothetical protein